MTDIYGHHHGVRGELLSDVKIPQPGQGSGALFVVPTPVIGFKSTVLRNFSKPPFDQGFTDLPVDTLMVYDNTGLVELFKCGSGNRQGNLINGHNIFTFAFPIMERALEGTVSPTVWPAGSFVSVVYSATMIEEIMAGTFIRQAEYAAAPLF